MPASPQRKRMLMNAPNANILFLPNGMFRTDQQDLIISEHTVPLWLGNLNLPWEEVLHLGVCCIYKKGQSIFSSEGNTRYFFYLQSGSVQSLFEDDQGEIHVNLYMQSGMLFNEMICMAGIHKKDFYIFVEDSKVVRFDRETLFSPQFLRDYPHLTVNLACSLARKALILAEFKPKGKPLETIHKVARLLYTLAASRQHLDTYPSHNEMARILNVHRSSIARVIKQLKEMGIVIRSTKHHLLISDMDRLKRLAIGDISITL